MCGGCRLTVHDVETEGLEFKAKSRVEVNGKVESLGRRVYFKVYSFEHRV